MNVKSCARWLLAVGLLFVSQAASPSDWTQLQPLSPNMITASGLDGNGKSALLPGGFRPSTSAVKTILFIDPSVADADTLLDGLAPSTVVIRLDAKTDGLSQMAEALAGYSGLDAIHILSHGSAGKLYLGSSTISQANLAQHAKLLAKIGSALSENGDILLYGCDVAQGQTGNRFIRSLAQYTGVDVAASNNLTGGKAQGGDWVLEASTGTVEAGQVLAADARRSYSHVLNYSDDYNLALMSIVTYYNDPNNPVDWKGKVDTTALNAWHELEQQGWSIIDKVPVGGFFATVFQNGDIIAIAYRGTDNLTDVISEDGDVRADRAIANPLADWTSQFDEAIKLAENIKSHNESSHIVVTGHSLGGALAQVSAKMFGFAGATFDPGGAGNITQSDQFNQWATNLVRDYHYPTSTINQSPNAAFVNYVVDHSQVSGWIGDHIGRQEQLDFFAYATTEELVIQSSTYVAHLALDKFKLAFLADAVTNALTTFSLHQMDGILDLMSIKKYDQITLELQQKYQQTIQQASDTGDVGKAGSSYGQPQTVFYSTSYNPYVFANDYDNIIYGTDGKDIIYSFAGNDKVYAGDGDDTISTAQGNDLIDAGDGSDTVYAGSGDDAVWLGVLVQGSQELADGGAGDDTLELDMTGLNLWQHFLKADNAGSPIVAQASNSWETIRAVAVAAMTGSWQLTYYNPLADGYQAVTVSNFEHVNVTGSNSDDLILFQGGTRYDGGNGTDAFYAGWSNATSNIVWNNDPTQTQTVNGVSLSGLERLLIATGSGNDTLTNLIVNTDDVFITGAGDDTVNAGGGNDRIEGGQDNNRLTGGSGTDVFTLNALGNDTITDFSKVESDQLDLATVLTQLTGYVSGNPFAPAAGYLALMQSAEGVRVLVDQDGKAGAAHTFKIIATINNLNAGALGSSQFVQGFAPTFLTNHAPAGADKTVTLAENAIYTFAVSDFGYTDPNDNPANALLRVKITTLPNAGSLKLNGVAVTVGQMVVIADINAGNLKFTPAVNASGTNYANFTFQVQDDGGTVNGGIDLDPMPNTFTFNVTANKASQTITFGAAPTIIVGGTGTISATGGASGNPVIFNSTTTAVCTTGGTNGSSVTGVTAGSCIIAANQLGNANYNAAPQVTQNFGVSAGLALTVSNLNSTGGTVTSDTGGIVCGSICTATINAGVSVKLTAIPVAGYQFSGWGGACSGYGNSCIVTLDAAKTVTANFEVFKQRHRPAWKKWLMTQ